MNAFSAPVSVGTSKEAGLTDFLAKNWRGGYMAKLRAGRFLREKPVGASIAAAGAALTPLAPIGIPVAALGVALSPALRAHARSLAGGTARGLRAAAPVAGQAARQAASGARGAYGRLRSWMTPPPPPPPPSFLERLVSGARGTTGRLTNALQPRAHNRYKQSSASALSPPSVRGNGDYSTHKTAVYGALEGVVKGVGKRVVKGVGKGVGKGVPLASNPGVKIRRLEQPQNLGQASAHDKIVARVNAGTQARAQPVASKPLEVRQVTLAKPFQPPRAPRLNEQSLLQPRVRGAQNQAREISTSFNPVQTPEQLVAAGNARTPGQNSPGPIFGGTAPQARQIIAPVKQPGQLSSAQETAMERVGLPHASPLAPRVTPKADPVLPRKSGTDDVFTSAAFDQSGKPLAAPVASPTPGEGYKALVGNPSLLESKTLSELGLGAYAQRGDKAVGFINEYAAALVQTAGGEFRLIRPNLGRVRANSAGQPIDRAGKLLVAPAPTPAVTPAVATPDPSRLAAPAVTPAVAKEVATLRGWGSPSGPGEAVRLRAAIARRSEARAVAEAEAKAKASADAASAQAKASADAASAKAKASAAESQSSLEAAQGAAEQARVEKLTAQENLRKVTGPTLPPATDTANIGVRQQLADKVKTWNTRRRLDGLTRSTDQAAATGASEALAVRDAAVAAGESRAVANSQLTARVNADRAQFANAPAATTSTQQLVAGGAETTKLVVPGNTAMATVEHASKSLATELEAAAGVRTALDNSSIASLAQLRKLRAVANKPLPAVTSDWNTTKGLKQSRKLYKAKAKQDAARAELESIDRAIADELKSPDTASAKLLQSFKDTGLRTPGGTSASKAEQARAVDSATAAGREADHGGVLMEQQLVTSGGGGGSQLAASLKEIVGSSGLSAADRATVFAELTKSTANSPNIQAASKSLQDLAKKFEGANPEAAASIQNALKNKNWNPPANINASTIGDIARGTASSASPADKAAVTAALSEARSADAVLDEAIRSASKQRTSVADAREALKAAQAASKALPAGKSTVAAKAKAANDVASAQSKLSTAQTAATTSAELENSLLTTLVRRNTTFVESVNATRSRAHYETLAGEQRVLGSRTQVSTEAQVIALQKTTADTADTIRALDAFKASGNDVSRLSTPDRTLLEAAGVDIPRTGSVPIADVDKAIVEATETASTAEAKIVELTGAPVANALTAPVAGSFNLANPLHAAGAAGAAGLGIGLLED